MIWTVWPIEREQPPLFIKGLRLQFRRVIVLRIQAARTKLADIA
jgi:hypothetical protein